MTHLPGTPTPRGRPHDRLLHVVVIIDGLGWGGAEMLLAEFAQGASSAGLRLSVCYLRDSDGSPAAARLAALGLDPVLLPMRGLLGGAVLPALRRHLRRLQPDVVHTHLGYSDLLGSAAARSLRVPVVSTVHLIDPEPAAGIKERTKNALFSLARRRGAGLVFAVSEAARQGHLAATGDRPEHTRVVHNGVVGADARGQGKQVRQELGLAADDLVVVMVSVLRPGKGHDVALQALRILRLRWPRLRLVILGAGPLAEDLAAQAADLDGAVQLIGHRDDVMDVLDAADVLLHPSRQDAFPTALLEAMAASLPVLATAVGGIPEIVVPDETGVLLAAPAHAEDVALELERLLADPDRRHRLGQAGRARFEQQFTAAAWATRARAGYEHVLAGAPLPPPGSAQRREAGGPAT